MNSEFWNVFKNVVIEQLKGAFVKAALKKILGTALMGGFKGWLVSFIAEELFDEIAKPLFDYLFRKAQLQINKVNGKITVTKFGDALENNNSDEYFDAFNDAIE